VKLSVLIERTRRRVRLIQLLEAAERAALTPISMEKLHAFAYLADVLSPVWKLDPFDFQISTKRKSPYYPDLQREIDSMIAAGLIEVSSQRYQRVGDDVLFSADFALRFSSIHANAVLEASMGDPDLVATQEYLNELASALASLADEDIAAAASKDIVYADSFTDIIDFQEMRGRTTNTQRAVQAFDVVFPRTDITPSRRLYMYAHYLGRRAHG